MALDSATSSDQSNSTGASGRSDGAVQGDLSDRARDALSSGGGAERASSAHAEPSLDERVASQERLAAEGRVAKETFERRQAAYATRGGTEPGRIGDVPSGGVQLAQATTGMLTDAMPGGLGLDDLARAGRAVRAASPAGAAAATAIGLERVNDIASQSRVVDAAERLGLDATTVEGVLAAEAYASVMERASTGFLPGVDKGRGPDAEVAAQAVALTELAAPGSYRSAFGGDPAARAGIDAAMQGAVAALEADRLTPVAGNWADGWAEVFPGISPGERDPDQLPGFVEGAQAAQGWNGTGSAMPGGTFDPTGGDAVERNSSVAPTLSAYSTHARRIVAASAERLPQNWQAHHEIPFNVVAKQPVAFQEALVDAGWIMDSPENLAALPANWESYAALPNDGALPMHNGSHPNYDAMVRDMLAAIVDSHENMSPEELRAAMNEVGERAMARINRFGDVNAVRRYHERLK